MKKYLLFNLIIIFIFSTLLVWISNGRMDDFYRYHSIIASESVNSAASEIERFIGEKKRLVALFGQEYAGLIADVAQNADDNMLYQQLAKNVERFFPDYFSFTITDGKGVPYIEDYDGFIGDLCLADLREFIGSGTQLPRIHPNAEAYHFDISTIIEMGSKKLVLFVNFHSDILGGILRSAQTRGHELMLVHQEASNLIEVTDKGARDNTPRTDYRLTGQEQDRILVSSPVPGTRWHVLDLYREELFAEYKDGIITNNLFIMMLFVSITVVMMFVLRKQSRLRLIAEQHKDEFLSVVSHELRTPITSIYGSLSLMANEVTDKLSDSTKTLVKIALSNCKRLNVLINDLLDIQKIEAGKMEFKLEVIRLLPFLEQCVSDNLGYANKLGVSFKLKFPPEELLVNIDTTRVAQVMANLLSNAAKYGAENDSVIVGVEKQDATVRVFVTDHGAGIPESFQSRLFQKFAQYEMSNTRNTSGTGLGLCIVKAIVEQHGGRVGYSTEKGVGTTFYFDLPLHQ